MITITIDIPALDRLCGILENQDKTGMAQAIENEIVAKLEAAVKGGVPRPKFTEVPVTPETEPETEPEGPRETTAAAGTSSASLRSAPSPEGKAGGPEPMPEPTPTTKPITFDQVQRAAAQLRDAGKLGAVTGMFGEFGIRKLSDLEGAKLALFAERLKKLGAKL